MSPLRSTPQDQPGLREREILETGGAGLLGQQIWCWGRDILRAEGNWLVEIGFDRLESPSDREECSSVYTLQLPQGRRVVLRGFGAFFGDDQHGGVFLHRYEFRPRYTADSKLECPPWSETDLPKMGTPEESQRDACASLTLGLIDWIRGYEVTILERLGIEYRRSTLEKWNNGNAPSLRRRTWRSRGDRSASRSARASRLLFRRPERAGVVCMPSPAATSLHDASRV